MKIRLFTLVVSTFLLITTYNNCAFHSASTEQAAQSGSVLNAVSISCSDTYETLFEKTYQPFLTNHCALCHDHGPGKGTFASADLQLAFQGFNDVGYEKINQNAVNNGHNFPYTGTQNTAELNAVKENWTVGAQKISGCQGGTSVPSGGGGTGSINLANRINTANLTLNIPTAAKPTDEFNKSWDITAAMVKGATGTGKVATVAVTVKVFSTATGQTAYQITRPRLFNNTFDIEAKSLIIRLNDRYITESTTFAYISTIIPKGTLEADGILSTGGALAAAPINPTDQMSLSFESLEVKSNSSCQSNAQVKFAQTSLRAAQAGGVLDVDVVTTGTPCQPIRVGVSLDTTAMNALTVDQRAVLYNNNFNWDFKYQNQSLYFSVGENKKTISVALSENDRLSPDKKIILRLDNPTGATKVDVPITLVIPAHGHAPTAGIPTYTQLMDPQYGVLGVNCVKCHNAVDRRGGYDMTNYQEMVDKGVLVPGDASSLMYVRLHADDTTTGPQPKPMPPDGFLPQNLIRPVSDWILDGAKNN